MATGNAKYDQLIRDLASDYRPQREWAEGRGFFLIIGHFVVGVAAGAWLFGLYYANTDAQILALVLGVLGGFAHLANLARPERALRMMTRVGTSWVARGFWGLSLFLIGGFLWLVPVALPDLAWPEGVATFGRGLAVIGAVILILYMGFVYTASKGIPFWNSPLHPVLYIAYAARGGAAAMLLVLAGRGQIPEPGFRLLEVWTGVTAAVILLWALEIHGALTGGDDATRRSMRDLLAGRLAAYFYAGTLFVGLVVPLYIIAQGFSQPMSIGAIASIGVASVLGDFFIKYSSIKAGIHAPVRLPPMR